MALPDVLSARGLETPTQQSRRYILGYTEHSAMARFGLRWFALVEADDEPRLIVWTRSHQEATKALRAFARPDKS